MEMYHVGGCVRDLLLGIEPKDFDYVVVGSSVEEMLSLGYTQVGKDFPVFLSKEGEEYALARKERSTGNGYNDFICECDNVSIEEDTFRRDLTINSIAKNLKTGEFIDAHGGMKDIENKILRPVSDHFAEDPVRVLRVARLRARYGAEWKLAPELVSMCSTMSKKGKMNALDQNRVWKELSRALMEENPRLFFDTLLELDCLHTVFPEIYKLLTALESRRWHPEGNAYEHTMLVLTEAAKQNYSLEVRFSCLMHDIGKGLTPFSELPRHHGHDVKGAEYIGKFASKYGVTFTMIKLAEFSARFHMRCHEIYKLKPVTIVRIFDKSKRNFNYIDNLVKVGICDERGRLGSENNSYDHVTIIYELFEAYCSVKYEDLFKENEKPSVDKIKQSFEKERVARVKKVLDESKQLH